MKRPTQERQVYVKALKRGTVNSTLGTFHFDPDGVPDARERRVPQSVFDKAAARGLVKRSRPDTAGAGSSVPSGPSINDSALARRTRNAGGENGDLKQVLGMTGAETRDTTAFQQEKALDGGLDQQGFERGQLSDTGDESTGENAAATLAGRAGDAPPNDGEGDDDDAGDGEGDGGSGEGPGEGGESGPSGQGSSGEGSGAAGQQQASEGSATSRRAPAASRKKVAGGRRPNAE